MMKLVAHPLTGLLIVMPITSRSSPVFLQRLRLIAGTYMLEMNKHVRWILP